MVNQLEFFASLVIWITSRTSFERFFSRAEYRVHWQKPIQHNHWKDRPRSELNSNPHSIHFRQDFKIHFSNCFQQDSAHPQNPKTFEKLACLLEMSSVNPSSSCSFVSQFSCTEIDGIKALCRLLEPEFDIEAMTSGSSQRLGKFLVQHCWIDLVHVKPRAFALVNTIVAFLPKLTWINHEECRKPCW